jgi:hydroxymethylglutaryl-CoA lyase
MKSRIQIFEVVARDGFQNEPRFVPTRDKVVLIDALSQVGVAKIEATAFVSPKAVPNMRDAGEVMHGIKRSPEVVYSALAPNLRGVADAIVAGAQEVNVVLSASESHNMANVRLTCEQSLAAIADIASTCSRANTSLNVSIATAFGCPFEGRIAPERVLDFVRRCVRAGAAGITLADTIGVANPAQVEGLVASVLRELDGVALTLHFHDTRGLGLANAYAAYRAGARRFDASLGGIGGCPFAPGATGNVCTEDMVHMFDEMGVETGINFDALLEIAKTLPPLLGHDTFGRLVKAGRAPVRDTLS